MLSTNARLVFAYALTAVTAFGCSSSSASDPRAQTDAGAKRDGSTDGSNGDGGPTTNAIRVDAGTDQTVQLPMRKASFLATAAEANVGLTFRWTKISGGPVQLLGETTARLEVQDLVEGNYVFRVEVRDSSGGVGSDDVALSVIADKTDCKGTTFYVSATGNDASGDGSPAQPFGSIAKATASVRVAGATIHVGAGTFTETARSDLAPGVCLEGEGASSIVRSTLTQEFAPIIEAVSPEGTNGFQHISKLAFDGTNLLTSIAITVAGRSYFSIHDCTVVNFRHTGVNFSGLQNWNGPTAPNIYAKGNSFYRNTVTNSSIYEGAYGRGNVQFGGQDGFLLYENTITQPARGNGSKGVGWPVKMANEGHIKGCKVFDNTLTKVPYTGSFGGDQGWNFAVEFWNVEGLEIYGNKIQGAVDLAGVGKGLYPYGMYFHDNVVSEPTLGGFYEEGLLLETDESDIIVTNNHFKNVSAGVAFAPFDYNNENVGIDVHRIAISGNLFESLGFQGGGQGVGIRFLNTDEAAAMRISDIEIDNNTLVAAVGTDAAIVGIQLPGYKPAASAKRVRVANNIIRGFSYASMATNYGGNLSDVVIRNNLFFGNLNQEPLIMGGTPANYTYNGSIQTDPQFAAGGFFLGSTSPAINAGIPVGRPFLGAAPDIGAFELR